LEEIGAVSPSQHKAAEKSNYQDSVSAPVARAHDDNAVAQEDEPEVPLTELSPSGKCLEEVLSAVQKVGFQVTSVLSACILNLFSFVRLSVLSARVQSGTACG
jgi:hypothetical protein